MRIRITTLVTRIAHATVVNIQTVLRKLAPPTNLTVEIVT